MSALVLFDEWKRYQATVVNVESDTFKLYLSNATPDPETDTVKADVAEITNQFGYATFALTTSWVETSAGSGVWSLRNNADKTFTAVGGDFGPFSCVVLFDDTPNVDPVDPLLGFWDLGAPTTITAGNSFLIDLDSDLAIYDLS